MRNIFNSAWKYLRDEHERRGTRGHYKVESPVMDFLGDVVLYGAPAALALLIVLSLWAKLHPSS